MSSQVNLTAQSIVRVLRSGDINYSGMGFVCEFKFQKEPLMDWKGS